MPIPNPDTKNVRGESWAYLDDETCFDLWNELGSSRKAAQALANAGVVNPELGRPPTAAGVYVAAIRYMIENIEEARQKVVDAGGRWANDKLVWVKYVVGRANKQ